MPKEDLQMSLGHCAHERLARQCATKDCSDMGSCPRKAHKEHETKMGPPTTFRRQDASLKYWDWGFPRFCSSITQGL